MTESPERATHWDAAYRSRGVEGVSWFEATPTVSLELIGRLGIEASAAVLDVGGGASSLVDHLMAAGFVDVTVLDVSEVALDMGRRRVGDRPEVSWLHQDVLVWQPDRRFGLWHDRAVFHFLTEEADRVRYLSTLAAAVGPNAGIVLATFAPDGPEYCSGLPVVRYSAEALAAVLGNRFTVVASRREVHTTPGGVAQPFTWVAARAAST
ncbi:MAG TPA: class I SAM-dependent methyltransferase [Acidimicrobiales bacterium]|nr:class I SAM-dependent methyltransferase [Acidimicrobiales bacterium]